MPASRRCEVPWLVQPKRYVTIRDQVLRRARTAQHLPPTPLRAGLRNPVPDRRFEHGQVDVAKCAELDAVPRHTRLADVTAVGPGQMRLVIEAHDVDGDSARIGAQANLIELPG